jgi:NhaA family Na+:H+ antiporter
MPWSNGLVVPLFALCACGIAWSQLTWSVGLRQFLGSIIVARVVGKVVGITGVVYVGTRLGLKGPAGVSTKVMAAAAALCAVGFTVPLLFAEAVYGFDNSIYAAVTLGLLLASVVAGVIGVTSLRILTRRSGDSVV